MTKLNISKLLICSENEFLMPKRILFVYRNVMSIPYIDFGIAGLSAYIKSKGYQTGLIDFTFGLNYTEAVRLAKKFNPDVICFSSRSNEFEHVVKTAKIFRNVFGVPIFCGGIHPTIAPDDALRDCFDGICIGEGEEALYDLLKNMEKGKYLKTKGFWFRKDGKIIKNPVRPLIKDLDGIPLFDYELFDMPKYLKARDNQIDYIGARGCPYNCAYCINHILQGIYAGKGQYVRMKSVDKIISELKTLTNRYKIKSIFFIDEIFNISTERLKEFAAKYSKEINIPFECCVRANLCSDENMKYLKQANCSKINIAIECGDEKYRKELLCKDVTDEQIINAFGFARKYKLHTMSYNMIGLPFETPQQIEKTIEINKKARADSIQASTFVPFPGTKLYNFCKEHNLLLNKKMDISYYWGVYLKNPNLTPKQLEHYRRWFSYKCYEDRSKIKATLLLIRDSIIPYYLIYGKYIPTSFKKMIYYLFWHTKVLKFMSK